MRTYADHNVSMRVSSLLDQLTDEQMEELQGLMKAESESPTVSERLSQMMAKVSENNEVVKSAAKVVKVTKDDAFAALLAAPLSDLVDDDGDDDTAEVDTLMKYA